MTQSRGRIYKLLSCCLPSIKLVAWSDGETNWWNVRDAWRLCHTSPGFTADSPHWIPWQPCMERNTMLPNVYRFLDTMWGYDSVSVVFVRFYSSIKSLLDMIKFVAYIQCPCFWLLFYFCFFYKFESSLVSLSVFCSVWGGRCHWWCKGSRDWCQCVCYPFWRLWRHAQGSPGKQVSLKRFMLMSLDYCIFWYIQYIIFKTLTHMTHSALIFPPTYDLGFMCKTVTLSELKFITECFGCMILYTLLICYTFS